MTRFQLAVVGAGRAGMLHARNANDWVASAEVACVVDADGATRQRAADELGVPAFERLDDAFARVACDAVVITTPTFTHCELAVASARHGKHVFCEKPMALTLAECDEMALAAEQAGVVLQMGFVRRFQPEFAEAKRRLADGAIGQPMLVKSLTRGPGLPPAWAQDIKWSNGMLAEVNSHDFDCARWLAASEIDRVYTETANFKGGERGVEARDFYDNAVVTLRFASGALGLIDGACPADYGYDARVEVLGTEGLLVVGDNRSLALLEMKGRGCGEVMTYPSWPARFESAYREELRSFVLAASAGQPPAVGPADGRAAVAAVLAANRSWREERPVRLDAGAA
ncbi:MAG TPA: Gfo/Idh/MocA family oxidoreductase [Acidimicrobiales bacterium]|nr:Gfo/Idh/MocA family oxidoreductase [Acidimicrobiales bacterium]